MSNMSDITGPSSEPKQPNVQMGTVAAATVRTGAQGGTAWIVMELTEAYNLYDFTDRQWSITLLAGTTFLAWLMNRIEKARGQRFIGAPT